jgi:SNF2 family DNA or RNA helicase
MLISRKKQAVVLNLRHPERVTTVIPSAKVFEFRGQRLVAVPHRHDETKVLKNLGFDVPHPIRLHYPWPGRYTPFESQKITAEFMAENPLMFCTSSMGTGKTLSALWTYDYLRQHGVVNKVLILAPLSTLERTWADLIWQNFPDMQFAVLHGSREKRLKLLANNDFNAYIINHDGLPIIVNELAKRPDINMVVVDEGAVYRNAGTRRWKTLNLMINKQKIGRRVVWMTGTPTPNDPTDAWAQCRIIAPQNVPQYFGRFRDMVMRQVSQFKWVARDDAMEVVRRAMQPAIRFTLEECVDLPEHVFITRQVEMTAEQKKAYSDMLSSLRAQSLNGEIMAVNEAVKASKLCQIACGVAYAQDGSEVYIPAPNRIEEVVDVCTQSEGKVLVFVPFTGALNYVATELSKHFSVSVVNGGTKKSDRDQIFGSFQKDRDPHVIVAQPGTMSHGLTLTAATTIIWYAPINSNEIYEQACARTRRPGQKRTTVVVHISGSDIERRMYTRLKNKQKMQGILLDLLGHKEDDDNT